MEITWLGHATVVLDMDGARIVADPLLRRHNGVLRRRGGRPVDRAWQGTDAVLLSHLHHDHAEVASLKMLGDVPVLTAVENAEWVVRKGLSGRGLTEDEWFSIDGALDVAVRLVPAIHHSRPMPHRPNAANGHLVRGPSGVVWIAGDTDLYPGMADLATMAGAPVDLAVVPIGGMGTQAVPRAHGAGRGGGGLSPQRRRVGRPGALEDPPRSRGGDDPERVDGLGRTPLRARPWPARHRRAGPWCWTSVAR